jgi:hypothetical protein
MRRFRLAAALALSCALAVACSSGSTSTGPSDAGAGADGAIACHSDADCSPALSCSPGGRPYGCGICEVPQNPCNTDSDCQVIGDAAPAQPMVCVRAGGCVCPVGKVGICIAACHSATDCGADEACAPTGHCGPKPCTSDSDCPSTPSVDYACYSGACMAKACKSDADCGGHYCVSGTCYPQPGICIPPEA